MVCDSRNILRAFRARLVRMLRLAAPREWENVGISLTVASGKQMAALNRRFTGRRGETDVLAFPLEDDLALPPRRDQAGRTSVAARREIVTVGEIVVNASLAVREAKARGAPAAHELALYVVHGALHLAGYDDHDAQSRQEMYQREAEMLRRAGIPCVRDRPRRKGRACDGKGARALPRKSPHV